MRIHHLPQHEAQVKHQCGLSFHSTECLCAWVAHIDSSLRNSLSATCCRCCRDMYRFVAVFAAFWPLCLDGQTPLKFLGEQPGATLICTNNVYLLFSTGAQRTGLARSGVDESIGFFLFAFWLDVYDQLTSFLSS